MSQRQVLQGLAWLSLLTLFGFCVGSRQQSLGLPHLLHVFLGVPSLVFVGVLTSGIEIAASLCVPADAQGWAMGLLNSAQAAGGVAGSLLGPALWTISISEVADVSAPSLVGVLLSEGRLPFVVTAAALLLCVMLLQCPLWQRAEHTAQPGNGTIDMVPIGCATEDLGFDDPENAKGHRQANEDENLPLNEENSKVC